MRAAAEMVSTGVNITDSSSVPEFFKMPLIVKWKSVTSYHGISMCARVTYGGYSKREGSRMHTVLRFLSPLKVVKYCV